MDVDIPTARALRRAGYQWCGHTHPGADNPTKVASSGDLRILREFGQNAVLFIIHLEDILYSGLIELRIEKKLAIEAADKYCLANGLSISKLHNTYSQIISDNLYFVVFPDIEPNGLLNDIETQGIPILIVNDDYSVTKTEQTERYLGE